MSTTATTKDGLKIVREFNAPQEMVFDAFANAEALAQWWGPVGMPITVHNFDFREGGKFHYKMEGNGQVMWGIFNYRNIQRADLIEFVSSFSDEAGNICKAPFPIDFPMEVFNQMTLESIDGNRTRLTLQGHPINATAEQEATYAGMKDNMNQGFKGTLDQLEQYINAQFKLRNENKTSTAARVTTYLNFPGNTEEAFNFYKKVFRSEFSGKGLQKFGDLPADSSHPPVAEEIKKMVLHVELPILGGHILMGTDAPKEMGFELNIGNNMHICLEPESREETERLFNELTNGGQVIMPMADMFFGAYFGQGVDKYGINWMFNHINK